MLKHPPLPELDQDGANYNGSVTFDYVDFSDRVVLEDQQFDRISSSRLTSRRLLVDREPARQSLGEACRSP
jgi:hypothetical protein